MPFINLIHEQRLQAQRNEKRSKGSFIALVAISSFVVVGWGFITFQIDRARSEQARLRGEIQRQTPIISEISLNEKANMILEPKVKTLEDGQKLTDKWSRILAHMAVQTPKGVWLTALRSASIDEENPTTVSLVGLSPDQSPVGEYILRLQNAKDLESVNPKNTHPKDFGGKPMVEFEITAQIKGTAKPKPAPKADGAKDATKS